MPNDAYTKLGEQGITLMGWADPFYPDAITPPHIIAATRAALEAGKTHYTIPIGSLELREAISRKLASYNGIKANPQTEIIITPGSDPIHLQTNSVVGECLSISSRNPNRYFLL